MRARAIVAVIAVTAVLVLLAYQAGWLVRLGLSGSESPRDAYLRELRDAGLDETPDGHAWRRAGETAIAEATAPPAPFRDGGRFTATAGDAVGYRWTLARGRRVSFAIDYDAPRVPPDTPASRLFVDLVELSADGAATPVAWLEPGRSSFLYDVERDGTYVLRLQPELRRGGAYAVAQRTLATLPFPLGGAGEAKSPFGVERDAGRRRHEGIDLFAPRGTPVVAVAAGLARAGTNTLGGNVVWLHPAGGGRTFYYAHLDRWAIDGWAFVRPGEVLGYVGTTGNAQRTPPHLHFGIYERGAIDPWPFVRPDDAVPGTGGRRGD